MNVPGTVNPNVSITTGSFLSEPLTQEYVPQAVIGTYGYMGLMNRNRPPFTYWTIRDMLCDPRVIFGLQLLKGPIVSNPTYVVETNDSAVGEFLEKNLARFWTVGAMRVLKAMEWGFSASEVLYRESVEDGLIYFDNVKDLESMDCRPVTFNGRVIGFRFRAGQDPNTGYTITGKDKASTLDSVDGWKYIGAPRALWHLHWRERNPWFGLSRLFGAHVPWYEMWSEDGFRQIRRLWFTGCAFSGGVMYHPTGTIATENGPKPARDYARQMVDQMRSGATLTLPNAPAGDGQGRAWEYVPPEAQATPAGLLEYGEDLRMEVFEALGVPPEVVQSQSEGGYGSPSGAGGDIPRTAYESILHDLATCMLLDFDACSLRYLVTAMFGPVEYTLRCDPKQGRDAPPTMPVDENGMPIEEGLEQGDEENTGDEEGAPPPG